MNTYAVISQESNDKIVVNNISPKQDSNISTCQFADHRPEAIAQRKMQETANNSLQVKEAGKLQEMANDYSGAEPGQAASSEKEALTSQPVTLQRVINTFLVEKSFKKAKKSKFIEINAKIREYNKDFESGDGDPESLLRKLYEIKDLLGKVGSNKKDVTNKIKSEVKNEINNIMINEVMELATKRANLQNEQPIIGIHIDNTKYSDAEDFMRSREVLHATDPLKRVHGKKTVGDVMADSNKIKNLHQTHQSLIGSDLNHEKRLNAEVGMLYPERYRRNSFSRTAYEKDSETKGINIIPPNSVLPKYGAVNLADSRFGALRADDRYFDIPLHFAIKEQVIKERTTFTSSDSLREWRPYESGFNVLRKQGMIKDDNDLPKDDQPWGMGPIATYRSNNFAQILKTAWQEPAKFNDENQENPQDYIEAQIHGELKIDRDISHVRANFAKLFGHPSFKSLYKSFQNQKMKIIWYYFADEKKDAQITQDWKTPDQNKAFDKAWKKANKLWKAFSKSEKKIDKKTEKQGLWTTQRQINMERLKLEEGLNEIWEELAEYFKKQPISGDIDSQGKDEIKDKDKENMKAEGGVNSTQYDFDANQRINPDLIQSEANRKRGSS